jgi:ATP-dependent DNA helicase RecG
MKTADFLKLVAAGEGEGVEFELGNAASESVAKVVCAFLNHRGGKVILGVDDNGRLVGVRDAKRVALQLQARLGSSITPSALWTVEGLEADGKEFIIVEVPEGMDKPYVANGAIYFSRSGKRVVPATRDEISRLIRQRYDASLRWERQIVVGASLDDLETPLIKETAQMALDAERWRGRPEDAAAFLHSLGLVENGGITNAALVLFGFEPTRWFPQARVQLLVLPNGKTADRHAVNRVFEKNLLRIAQQIPEALALYVGGVEAAFPNNNWQREERLLYPATALREGIMNALIHRDYSRNGAITVAVQPTGLKISNPGGLPGELKPSDLKRDHASVPRNPDIAHVCYLRKLIEKIGRGTQRIIEDCRAAKIKEPKWVSSLVETSLSFSASTVFPKSSELEALSDRQRRILDMLKSKGSLKALGIAKLLGGAVTDRTIRNYLLALVERGWITKRGQGPSTTYAAVKKERNQ